MNNIIKLKTENLQDIIFNIKKISITNDSSYTDQDDANYIINRQISGIVEYESIFNGSTLSLSFGWVAGGKGSSFSKSFNYEFDYCSSLDLETNFLVTDFESERYGGICDEIDDMDDSFIYYLEQNSKYFEDWTEHSVFDPDDSVEYLKGELVNESSNLDDFTLERIDKCPLNFKGEMITSCSSHSNSNNVNWEEYALYKAHNGEYVCHKLECSIMGGYHEYSYVIVTSNEESMRDFFGDSEIATELFELA